MRRLAVTIILVATLVAPVLVCGADTDTEGITPFGGIQWSDSFASVIVKIKAIPGISRVEVKATGSGKSVPVTSSTPDASELVREAIRNSIPLYLEPDDRRLRLRFSVQKYFDTNGVEQRYPPKGFSIVGSSITISGASFEITAAFEPIPGYAILHKEGVVEVSVYRLPLALIEVALKSRDPNLPEVVRDIDAALKSKYGKYDPEGKSFVFPARTAPWDAKVETAVVDTQGSVIRVYCCRSGYSITYEHNSRSVLDEVYRKHLAKLQKPTGPDRSSDL